MFEINYSQLIQYEILEKLVTFIFDVPAVPKHKLDLTSLIFLQLAECTASNYQDFFVKIFA